MKLTYLTLILTPALSKQKQNVISNNQHGFLTGSLVNSNLVSFLTDVSKNMNYGKETHAVYTDFQSAFDKVGHLIFLNKLCISGIHGSLLNCFKS